MSGTSLDAVDAAMILTDGERVLEFGPTVERTYSDAERAVLKAAVDAAITWNWTGPQPEAAFAAAREVLARTHTDAFQMLVQTPNAPEPAIAGVHGQTVLHRRPTDRSLGATLQLFDADASSAPRSCQLRMISALRMWPQAGKALRWHLPIIWR